MTSLTVETDTTIEATDKSPAFVFLLLLSFLVPFGSWQESIFAGLSAPKIFVPLALLVVVSTKATNMKISRTTMLTGLFVVVTSPSLIVGVEEFSSVFLVFLGYFFLSIVFDNVTWSHRRIEMVLISFLLGLSLIAGLTYLAIATGADLGKVIGKPLIVEIFNHSRIGGTEENPNAFAVFFTIGIPIAVHMILFSKRGYIKLFYVLCIILLSYVLVLTFSRAALLGAGVGVYTYFFVARRNTRTKLLAICMMLLLAGSLFLFGTSFSSFVFDYAGVHAVEDKLTSVAVRQNVLGPVIESLFVNPLVGIGYGNLREHLLDSHVAVIGNTHNIFLGVASSFGFIALFSFLSILLPTLFRLYRSIKISVAEGHSHINRLTFACALGLLTNGMFHEGFVSFLFWMIFFLCNKVGSMYCSCRPDESGGRANFPVNARLTYPPN